MDGTRIACGLHSHLTVAGRVCGTHGEFTAGNPDHAGRGCAWRGSCVRNGWPERGQPRRVCRRRRRGRSMATRGFGGVARARHQGNDSAKNERSDYCNNQPLLRLRWRCRFHSSELRFALALGFGCHGSSVGDHSRTASGLGVGIPLNYVIAKGVSSISDGVRVHSERFFRG